ncbi:hypothetical protein [Hephaestia mangrovi]|uniref:hypothetical protein n=1 Tax=Hephaestia mangrovi TaxID=2873268 RepID=UPI001CA6BDD4|nr:hypothetical protein [Hephaestia mangrovi]MBY8826767.1 hypothetical protein [Hephaestia mangrovi]
MRKLFSLLPIFVVVLFSAGEQPPASSGKCPEAKITDARRDQPVKAHPLNREPGAKQEIAVLHYDADHCVKPIVVRDDVGGKSK